MIVLDTSVAASWFFADEDDDLARDSAQRTLEEGALVPPIFPSELGNALLFASRKGRVSRSDLASASERMAQLPIRIDAQGFDLREDIELAHRYGLTLYDAMYLALARRRRIPLLTRDGALQKAAAKERLADTR